MTIKSFIGNTKDLLAQAQHLPALISIATLWNQANDDKIPGFTPYQAEQLINAAFPLVPASVKQTATKPELLEAFVAINALVAPVKAFIPLVKTAWVKVKALFTKPTINTQSIV